ncbi:MAG: acyl-CoA thioesterase [Gammaproteobacteria bacterium]
MSNSKITSSPPDLGSLLTLESAGPGRFRSTASQPNRSGGVFGGQLLAQMLRAAELSAVTAGRTPHSLQANFVRGADVASLIDYEVEEALDGRTETLRVVRATQGNRLIATGTVAFSALRSGLSYPCKWTQEPPAPEQVEPVEEVWERFGAALSPLGLSRRVTLPQVEVRPLEPAEYFLVTPGPPRSRLWIRCRRPAAEAALSAFPSGYGAITFISDYLATSAALVAFVGQIQDRPIAITSLNHSLWLHADGDPFDWLLIERESQWSDAGRSLSGGRIFRRDGTLVATAMQETLISVSSRDS